MSGVMRSRRLSNARNAPLRTSTAPRTRRGWRASVSGDVQRVEVDVAAQEPAELLAAVERRRHEVGVQRRREAEALGDARADRDGVAEALERPARGVVLPEALEVGRDAVAPAVAQRRERQQRVDRPARGAADRDDLVAVEGPALDEPGHHARGEGGVAAAALEGQRDSHRATLVLPACVHSSVSGVRGTMEPCPLPTVRLRQRSACRPRPLLPRHARLVHGRVRGSHRRAGGRLGGGRRRAARAGRGAHRARARRSRRSSGRSTGWPPRRRPRRPRAAAGSSTSRR